MPADKNSAAMATAEPHPVEDARRVLSHHGKSFHWATRFFDPATTHDVAALYSFCRHVDDIADHQSAESARQNLSAVRTALVTSDGSHPRVAALVDVARRRNMDLLLPRLLVDAIIADIGPVCLSSLDDLICYAYGVAGTVGLMMCAVMDVREPTAKPFAVDLGIAMQLTNIARDVIEDAWRERRYLPGELLGENLSPATILEGRPEVQQRVIRVRKKILEHATLYYRSADYGMRFIPWRARLAVVTAARLYEAIGDRLQSGSVGWGERAFIGRSAKIKHTIGALGSLLLNPIYRQAERHPDHKPELHRALSGLPGADSGPS